jgi:NTE family protein
VKKKRRVGVVLGAGGVLGAAWTAGALHALQRRLRVGLGEVDVLVGTSAGAILATALRAGIDADGIVDHQRGAAVPGLPDPATMDTRAHTGLPPLPYPGVGSLRMLAAAAASPWQRPASVVASACLPTGRADLTAVRDLVTGLLEHVPRNAAGAGSAGTGVPGDTWITALDYDRGARVAFGRDGDPTATLPEAVAASCAIPAWYRPVEIDGRRYVDGGTWSSTSADLLAEQGLDEVYVLAPMASETPDAPRDALTRLERKLRRRVTAGLSREVEQVRRTGTTVRVLTPGPHDLSAIGANLMNPRHRERVLETSLVTSAAALGPSSWRGARLRAA